MNAGGTMTADGRSADDLIAVLYSEDAGEREGARAALVALGRRAIPQLSKALSEGPGRVRWEAAKALSEIADPSATPVLLDALQDENGSVRWIAAEGLDAIGKPALVPMLERLVMHSESVWLREGVHYVLNRRSKGDLRPILDPVLVRLDGVEPRLGVLTAAATAIRELYAAGYR